MFVFPGKAAVGSSDLVCLVFRPGDVVIIIVILGLYVLVVTVVASKTGRKPVLGLIGGVTGG